MNALAGTIGERAANIIAGGCDIVLHCNGHMDEMQQVVANVPLLQGKPLERARRVEQGFPMPDTADEAAIRAEFDAMFATV
jgi:beta-N-acetylhexosaminidase